MRFKLFRFYIRREDPALQVDHLGNKANGLMDVL